MKSIGGEGSHSKKLAKRSLCAVLGQSGEVKF